VDARKSSVCAGSFGHTRKPALFRSKGPGFQVAGGAPEGDFAAFQFEGDILYLDQRSTSVTVNGLDCNSQPRLTGRAEAETGSPHGLFGSQGPAFQLTGGSQEGDLAAFEFEGDILQCD
jgi:hypothetical protein